MVQSTIISQCKAKFSLKDSKQNANQNPHYAFRIDTLCINQRSSPLYQAVAAQSPWVVRGIHIADCGVVVFSQLL